MINEGYEITDRIEVGEVGFALGYDESAPAPYATWQYTAGKADFFWGHYFSNRFAVVEDLCQRALSEVKYQKESEGIVDKESLLPDVCYCMLPSTGEPVLIRNGEKGYYPFPYTDLSDEEKRSFIDAQNAVLEVSRQQEAAMLHGSMFGWKTKGADPRNYDESGKPVKPQKNSRGVVR